MSRRDDDLQRSLEQDLVDLKLHRIAEIYKEVLDDAARKGLTPLGHDTPDQPLSAAAASLAASGTPL